MEQREPGKVSAEQTQMDAEKEAAETLIECPRCGSKARTNGIVFREGRVKERFICSNKHTFYNANERELTSAKKIGIAVRRAYSNYVWEHWSDELQTVI
jgi:transposase-like protein